MDPVDYPKFHQDRVNLAIHLVAVPMFVAGTLSTVTLLATMHWVQAGASALVPALAFAAQGAGHRREPNPPVPFAGPGDFASRVLLEQFFRFWRYLLTGGWWAAWKAAA